MKKLAILLLILITFVSCKDEINVITSKQPGKIVGTVLPKEAVATVELIQGEIISTTVTNSGIFQFKDVHPGIYRITIKADDFGKQEIENIRVEDGEGNDIGIIELLKYPFPLRDISPFDGSENISTTTTLRFEFSENIDPSSFERALMIEPKVITDRIYTSNKKKFSYYTTFNFGTKYEVTLDTTITTEYGEHLEFPYTMTFTTIDFMLTDIYYPDFSQYGNDYLALSFTSELSQNLEDIVTVEPNISVELSYSRSRDSRLIISPTFGWTADTTFNITISEFLEEINGATLKSDTTISFTTPKLKIVDTQPSNNQHSLPTNSTIYIEANYMLDEGSIQNAISITPSVEFDIIIGSIRGSTAIRLYPKTELSPNTEYTVTIDNSLTDYYGVPLREDYIFSFTTKE